MKWNIIRVAPHILLDLCRKGFTIRGMTPVFKSTYSIGKSILTLDTKGSEGGPDSIIEICKENSINSLVLVEDSMTGFVTAHNRCKEAGIDLVFGLRITCCNNTSEDDNSDHKIVIFAKNDEGCRLLYRIYSHANTGQNGKVDFFFKKSEIQTLV